MKNRHGWFLVSALLLLLAGCGGLKAPPSPATPAAGTAPSAEQPVPPAGEQAPPAPQTPQAAAENSIGALGPRPVMSENKAVIALLDRASSDNGAGKQDAAEASLERALRIEPRNPWLWLELARVRLARGQYAQAITLARKSNSFAGGRHRVQAENWQLIGQARVAQGDAAGAEQAFKRAEELARQAGDEH